MRVAEKIETKLRAALAPARLEIVDESDRHAGHAGARPGGETHFSVVIVSDAFAGLGRIERQRLVHGLLEAEFAGGLHALSLVTRTPDEDRRIR